MKVVTLALRVVRHSGMLTATIGCPEHRLEVDQHTDESAAGIPRVVGFVADSLARMFAEKGCSHLNDVREHLPALLVTPTARTSFAIPTKVDEPTASFVLPEGT